MNHFEQLLDSIPTFDPQTIRKQIRLCEVRIARKRANGLTVGENSVRILDALREAEGANILEGAWR